MSDKDYDQFNNVKNASYGVFEGSALKAHDSVRAVVRRDGVVLEFECQGCSGGQQLTLEWPEVIALKYGVDPAFVFRGQQGVLRGTAMSFEPKHEENAWRPVAGCQKCNFHHAVRISFDEPERWLEQARRGGYVPNEAQLSQFCSKFAASARPQQARQQGMPAMPPMPQQGLIRR